MSDKKISSGIDPGSVTKATSDQFKIKIRAVVIILGGAAALFAIGIWVIFWSFKQIEQSADARKHTAAMISIAKDLLSSMKDAETGERGYLITGNEAFLTPYLTVRDNFGSTLNELSRLSEFSAASGRVETLRPLINAKMSEISLIITSYRTGKATTAIELVSEGEGKRLMDSIRSEISAFIEIEEDDLAIHEEEFASNMRRLLTAIVMGSLVTLAMAISFAYSIYRQTRRRIEASVHKETQHLLEIQEALNARLIESNQTLRASEAKLSVTLNSIGDAVIATDIEARVTLLNPIAEKLTGWKQAEAIGRPITEIFNIVNKETREPSTIPIMQTLSHGTVQGLANHTVLISRDGGMCDIADSCAPIMQQDKEIIGAVLVFRNVTSEYATQQALRDSSVLVQAILNTVVDGIVTLNADGGIVATVNPAVEHMFGFTAEELKDKKFSMLIPELDQDPRKTSLEYYEASEEARANGLGREVSGRRKDGRSFPLEIAVSEMWLGGHRYFTGLLRDISARKLAEAALLKAGALQNAIFHSANFSSIATDAKGVIQIFNVGAERMLGYSAGEVMNQITPADISDPYEVVARAAALSAELDTPITPGFEALVFKASRGIEDIYELTYIRKDGSRFPAVVSVTALRDDENTIIGYLLIGTDNTARKRVEAERALLDSALQEKNVELESARIIAEKANLAKSDFLSNMSHELRTPLSAILGFAQLMETGLPPPTTVQKRSIEQILKAGWYLLDLINEILDLAIIESGKLSMSLEPVSLGEVMRECATMIEPQAEKHGIVVSFTHFDKPCFIKADRMRVKQILINLLSNAIKYNKAGGTVHVETVPSRTNFIRVSIRDTGDGLSSEQIQQLFQPFNRLGQEWKSVQGTGIGLVVSKRLVEWMGGVIGVESIVGEGSMFWVEFKLTAEPSAARVDELEREPAENIESAEPLYTLLYVEDNPANLMLVEDLIARRSTIRLLSAMDGLSGVALAKSALPDIILMDINLPGISGLGALKILSEDPTTSHIPIVALSANAIPRDIEKGLKAGFFRYLTKPIRVDEFMKTLDQTLVFAKENNDSQ